jgi:hypothetical protein
MEPINPPAMTENTNYQKVCAFQGMELGYIERSHWAIKKPHVLVELTPATRKNTLSWLPLLEGDYSSFKQALQMGVSEAALNNIAVDFPLQDLLVTALESHDDYWAQRGLSWAEAAQQASGLTEPLKTLMADKRVSQATRHAAKKLLFTAASL